MKLTSKSGLIVLACTSVLLAGSIWGVTLAMQAAGADRIEALKAKGEQVKQGIEKWVQQDRNPSEIVALAKRAPALMRQGKIDEGEALLDRALELLEQELIDISGIQQVRYDKFVIHGDEKSRNGNFDPSVEYTSDGSVGWLVYSSVDGQHKRVGPYIHTHLAKTTDAGRTWTYVKTINTSVDATLEQHDGKKLAGVWRYEVPTLVHDPTDKGKEWKLFAHRYFWGEQSDQIMAAYGWIAYRDSHDPSGEWSDEVPLFGAGRFPPAPYNRTKIDLNRLHGDLRDSVAYTEAGALVHEGVLYLCMTHLVQTGPDFVFLIASHDHGKSWKYVRKLLSKNDATRLGNHNFDGSSLAVEDGRVYLLTTPKRGQFEHFGTYVFEFDDITQGTLKRDSSGRPLVARHILPQGGFMSDRGGGQSTYDAHNTYGGVIFPQINVPKYPKVFELFNTREKLLPSL